MDPIRKAVQAAVKKNRRSGPGKAPSFMKPVAKKVLEGLYTGWPREAEQKLADALWNNPRLHKALEEVEQAQLDNEGETGSIPGWVGEYP
jgi:hypothetical protein